MQAQGCGSSVSKDWDGLHPWTGAACLSAAHVLSNGRNGHGWAQLGLAQLSCRPDCPDERQRTHARHNCSVQGRLHGIRLPLSKLRLDAVVPSRQRVSGLTKFPLLAIVQPSHRARIHTATHTASSQHPACLYVGRASQALQGRQYRSEARRRLAWWERWGSGSRGPQTPV